MSTNSFQYAIDLKDGIYAVDTGFVRPQFDACYVMTQRAPSREHIAIIDTGTNYSVPRILASLSDLECSPDDVDYILLTHVHLDHAGGAGSLMRECRNAKLVVHPRGSRHMIDPTQLRAGAVAVYGEEIVQRDYGTLLPVDSHRVIEASDGMMINLAGRVLTCIETPGHAKHHITIWDQQSRGAFTGDTFGLSYREFDTEKGAFIVPTTTPIQFDPKALRISLKRIMALNPQCLFPTHFSKVTGVERLYQKMIEMLNKVEDLGKSLAQSEDRHERLKNGLLNLYIQELRDHGCVLSDSTIEQLLHTDIELNAQGMGVWLG